MKAEYNMYSDAELFRLFTHNAKKKDAAFTELYARYAQKVYMFCLRMAGNPDDANDMFQEAFTKFYHRQFHDEFVANIQAYLITTARNAFLNNKRTIGRWSPFEDSMVIRNVPVYEREELFNIINSALELLDATYREVFIMRFYQGFSYKEISDITGDSISSLKVRVMRAKDQLRSILSPYILDLSK